jgi:hypothetical protein
MKKVIFVVLIVASLFFVAGCFAPSIEKPAPIGTNCSGNDICFATNFLTCEEAYGNISPDANTELYLQIIGYSGEKCEVYLQVNKAASVPEMFLGLDAICKVTPQELLELQESMNIGDMDCKGPLYDAAITAKNLGLLD